MAYAKRSNPNTLDTRNRPQVRLLALDTLLDDSVDVKLTDGVADDRIDGRGQRFGGVFSYGLTSAKRGRIELMHVFDRESLRGLTAVGARDYHASKRR